MVRSKILLVAVLFVAVSAEEPSAVELVQDIYTSCLKDLSVKCAKPKALHWLSEVVDKQEIRITEDLVLVKKDNPAEVNEVCEVCWVTNFVTLLVFSRHEDLKRIYLKSLKTFFRPMTWLPSHQQF